MPNTISAFKSQQSRWAKGSIQCLLKYGWAIWAARDQSPGARLYALLSMGAYLSHSFLILLLLLQLPLLLLQYQPPGALTILALAGVSQPALLILGQRQLYKDWRFRLKHIPTLALLAIGISASATRAVLEAVAGGSHVFVRTPKGSIGGDGRGYKLPFDGIVLLELSLATYSGAGICLAFAGRNHGPIPFLVSCLMGFGFVGVRSLWEQRLRESY